MPVTLQRLASADTNYVSKHNSNLDALESLVNSLELQAGGASALSVPTALRALFGSDLARLGSSSYAATEDGTDLVLSSGYAWLPNLNAGTVVSSAADQTLSFSGVSAGTWYVQVGSSGAVARTADSTDALYQVVWSGSGFTSVTSLATVSWADSELRRALESTPLGELFAELGDRLTAAERATQAMLEVVVTSADVTPAEVAARQAQFIRTSGTLTGARALILPAIEKFWGVHNTCSGSYELTVKTASGSGVVVGAGEAVLLYCDGTNVSKIGAAGVYMREGYWPGTYSAGQVLFRTACTVAHSYPANLSGSAWGCEVAPTSSSAVVNLKKNGSVVGTITFAVGSTTGTASLAGGLGLTAGDTFVIEAPASANAAFAGFFVNLQGAR
jgi:hypothetical protein